LRYSIVRPKVWKSSTGDMTVYLDTPDNYTLLHRGRLIYFFIRDNCLHLGRLSIFFLCLSRSGTSLGDIRTLLDVMMLSSFRCSATQRSLPITRSEQISQILAISDVRAVTIRGMRLSKLANLAREHLRAPHDRSVRVITRAPVECGLGDQVEKHNMIFTSNVS
jgi:hypothetical protein